MSPEATAEIPEALVGQRLDRVVSIVTGMPRAEAADLVVAGAVRVGGRPVTRGSRRMALGEVVEITTTPGEATLPAPDPDIPLQVVHEDPWLVVVDKPAGLVVHPGAGNRVGTLVNALLARYPEMAGAGGDPDRPGIVHRLDKGTSGLLVVARTAGAHAALTRMITARQVSRSYLALVLGAVEAERGVVDAPVGRSTRQPTRMSVTAGGREARTRYQVARRFGAGGAGTGLTLLECTLETGRTHQIRVHLAAIGHPVAGDPAYGRPGAAVLVPGLSRPFLHAHRLAFDHPAGTGPLDLTSPLPADLEAALSGLA